MTTTTTVPRRTTSHTTGQTGSRTTDVVARTAVRSRRAGGARSGLSSAARPGYAGSTTDLPRQLTTTPAGPPVVPSGATERRTEATGERTDLGETYLLAQAVRRVAVTPRLWRPVIRFDHERPFAVRVPGPKGVDVWLRTWLPGQHTGLIDLGACATAFAVVQGALDDVRADDVLGTWITHLPSHSVRIIEPRVVHDLRGSEGHTVSIHAYSPRLREITEHSWDDGRLSRVGTVPVNAPWEDPRTKSA